MLCVKKSCFAIVFFTLSFAVAADIGLDWRKRSYAHYSDKEPVESVLRQFASSIGSPIVISGKVKGSISGNFKRMVAPAFLDRLSQINELIWYHDGQVLYIYHSGEVETAIIQSSYLTSLDLDQILKTLGIWDPRYSLKAFSQVGIARISGPPRYIELVKQVADILVSGERENNFDPFMLNTFELKYAWADDREFQFKGKEVIVAGVASTLKELLAQAQGQPPPQDSGYHNGALPKLKGQGLLGRRGARENSAADSTDVNNDLHKEENAQEVGDRTRITANERLNAVVVYDKRSRMPLYEELIRSLDKPMDQIQIEVSIIDVNIDKLEDIGIEWQVSGKHGRGIIGKFPRELLPDFGNEIALTNHNENGFSTIIPGAQDFFMSRVRLLAQDGEAQILSQPTVLTLDNIEAVLDNSTTFFVRLEGQEEVDLFPVSVGSVLRVKPHIIEDNETLKVHMDINIEDGQQSQAEVDNIPAISKSVINTQALVRENNSLLVGGYFFDSTTKSVKKVPFLGDIPLLGRAFRSNNTERRKLARLFLITPTVVKHSRDTAIDQQADEYIEQRSLLIDRLRSR